MVCTLNRDEGFVSTLEPRSVDAMPGSAAVLVSGQWLGAHGHKERQVRFKAVVGVADFQTIALEVSQFLEDEPTKNEGKQANENE